MGRWDIDPAGVRSVVTRTAGAAKAFEGQAKAYAARLESAVGATGSRIVGQAVVDFATSNQDAFDDLVGRATRVLNGAVDATAAYLHGDLEMAERAQRGATATPPPDDLPPTRGPR